MNNHKTEKGTAIFLCDYTGIMAQPWIEGGYRAVLIDPQHNASDKNATPETISNTIEGGAKRIGEIIKNENVVFVFGFPPCTDVAVSGAAHFDKKRAADPHFQAKAALIAEQCRMVGLIAGCPWGFENPVSVFSNIFGKPSYTFHPYEYGGYLPIEDRHPHYPELIAPRDAYPKKTCLWTGGGFQMPEKKPVPWVGGYSDQHKKLGGKSLKTKNIRSATPRGFARAVYESNKPT